MRSKIKPFPEARYSSAFSVEIFLKIIISGQRPYFIKDFPQRFLAKQPPKKSTEHTEDTEKDYRRMTNFSLQTSDLKPQTSDFKLQTSNLTPHPPFGILDSFGRYFCRHRTYRILFFQYRIIVCFGTMVLQPDMVERKSDGVKSHFTL